MSDYSELKRLAEAALRNWPDSKLFERPECDRFIDAARPDVVLELIERATGGRQHILDSVELRSLCQHRDQLKAENESLRKALTDVREELGREYWDQYAGLDETRDILDAAMSRGEKAGG